MSEQESPAVTMAEMREQAHRAIADPEARFVLIIADPDPTTGFTVFPVGVNGHEFISLCMTAPLRYQIDWILQQREDWTRIAEIKQRMERVKTRSVR